MIGPFINSACIVAGALLGTLLARKMNDDFQKNIMLVFGCISTGLGIFMISKSHALPPVVCALMGGTVAGELCRIEAMVTRLSRAVGAVFARRGGQKGVMAGDAFQEQFAVFTVVFSASGLGFFGAMQEGLTGDYTMLLIKALLDLPTAMFIAANIGAVIGVLCVPQFTVQAMMLFSAELVSHWATPDVLADFSGCGGFITLATGIRMCGIAPFPILSMLPALLLVMPLSVLWTSCIV